MWLNKKIKDIKKFTNTDYKESVYVLLLINHWNELWNSNCYHKITDMSD